MARPKSAHPSTAIEELPKDCSWLEYMHRDSFKFFPAKAEWPKRVIYSMYAALDVKDAKGREPIDIMQFCRIYKIKYRSLRHMVDMNPEIKEAFEDFKLHLAANRRIGAAYRELDKDVIFKNQHHYDPEWDEVNKYHAALKADQETNETKIVVIEKMPESKMVKEKK